MKTIIGTGSVAGRSAFVIELRPPDRSSSSLRIWVDMETWVPLQWEGRDASGRLVSKTAYRSIQFDSPIPDPVLMPPSRFFDVQPTLPIPVPDDGEGARVAGFRPRRPGYLPPGYRFQTQTVASFGRGNRTAQRVTLLFSNGLGVISLVEAPAVAIQSAPPPGRLRWTPLGQLVWVRDGLHHVLHATPPLSREEMRRIADSVR